MMFINKTGSPKIDLAIKFVTEMLVEEFEDRTSFINFYQNIKVKKDFTFTKDEGTKVAEVLKAEANQAFQTDDIEVRPYRTKWPWSSVIGYSDGENVYINMRKINSLSISDYVGNLVHEFCHHAGYGHGDNNISRNTERKLKSVPYYCGELASGIYDLSKK
jgi:hypothetical protein